MHSRLIVSEVWKWGSVSLARGGLHWLVYCASQALGPCPWCAAADQWPSLERMTTVESGRNEMTFWSSFFFFWNSEMQWTHGMVEGGLGWELEVLVFSVETPSVSVPIICSVWVLNWMTSRASQRKGTSYKKEWRFLHFIGFAENFTSTQRRLWPIASFTWWTGQFATLFDAMLPLCLPPSLLFWLLLTEKEQVPWAGEKKEKPHIYNEFSLDHQRVQWRE